MADITKWEYRVQTLGAALKQASDEEIESQLDEWGLEGWEVVAVHKIENSGKVRVIARRSLPRSTRPRNTWP